MANHNRLSKRFGALATGFRDDPFISTRLRLTLFYVGAVTGLILLSSVVVYIFFANNIYSNQEGDFATNQFQRQVLQTQLQRLREITIIADLGMLLLSGMSGWWLAGRTLRPIREMVNSQRNFVASASHDLRTPLATIRTNTDLALRKLSAKDSMREFHEVNLMAVSSLDQLTEELLWRVRSEGAGHRQIKQPVGLVRLTDDIIAHLRLYAAGAKIKLRFKKPVKEVVVTGAAADLRRALTNIVKNAVDYSPRGGVVTISLSHVDKLAKWTCEDQGIGIEAADLPHIFKRYYRGSIKQPGAQTPGSGLGLTITKTIIESHGGSVRAESMVGKGTTIFVTLPIQPASS